MEIERKLREARENAGLTQEQLAQAVLVSRQTISNWENGKSLPDIISIMKLSDLYKISVDELLKGDKRVQKKIEKDASVARANIRVMLVTAAITLMALTVYVISAFVGGAFNDFCENAIKWVLAGIGVAFAITCLINTKGYKVFEFIKGAFKMKKLQIMAIVFLLVGIWLCIAPIGKSSNIPEIASIASVVLGVGCGIASLFVKEE